MSVRTNLLALVLFALVGCSHEGSDATHTTTRRTASGTAGSDAERESPGSTSAAEARREDDERRRSEAELPGAMDQSNDPGDMEISRAIRAAVVTDGSLSFAARNVVIVTRSSVVTLRGDVSTDDERRTIGAHARGVAGVTRVDNLLAVVP